MKSKFTLTGDRKIMNMAKHGIVSRSLKTWASFCKPVSMRLCGLMRYTLCEYQEKEIKNKWNSLRKDFGNSKGFAILP